MDAANHVLIHAREKAAARDAELARQNRVLSIRYSEARRRREDAVAAAIYRRAVAIHNDGSLAQDTRILCPVKAAGYWCQWVAGHYGSCVLGRSYPQRTRKGL